MFHLFSVHFHLSRHWVHTEGLSLFFLRRHCNPNLTLKTMRTEFNRNHFPFLLTLDYFVNSLKRHVHFIILVILFHTFHILDGRLFLSKCLFVAKFRDSISTFFPHFHSLFQACILSFLQVKNLIRGSLGQFFSC